MDYPDKKIFPLNAPTDFNKRNKKTFSESFVKENLRKAGWTVYIPTRDTGLDLIATKIVKQDNTTSWDSYETKSSDNIKIVRFIQVKTRDAGEDKNFGFTPKSTDISTDPRYTFFLYSDRTNDFIILPIYDFLDIMNKNYQNYFKTPTFKQGNGKINNFVFKEGKWTFSPGNFDLTPYVNSEGLKRLQDVTLDKNLQSATQSLSKLRYRLMHGLVSGNTFKNDKAGLKSINSVVQLDRKKWINNVISARKKEIDAINSLNEELKESIKKYWFISKELSKYLETKKHNNAKLI